MDAFPTHELEEEACREFNGELMRALITRKMIRNKTFFEAKILGN